MKCLYTSICALALVSCNEPAVSEAVPETVIVDTSDAFQLPSIAVNDILGSWVAPMTGCDGQGDPWMNFYTDEYGSQFWEGGTAGSRTRGAFKLQDNTITITFNGDAGSMSLDVIEYYGQAGMMTLRSHDSGAVTSWQNCTLDMMDEDDYPTEEEENAAKMGF